MFVVCIGVAALANGTSLRANTASLEVARGEYVFHAAGCVGCHTVKLGKRALLAGGRTLKTPFGVFHSPNITPDAEHGIGTWSEADFVRAMRFGVAPDGSHYFPVFPYTSYTRMTDDDLRGLWVYIRSLPPVGQKNKPHQVKPPFGWRFLVAFWKWLYFTPGPFRPDPARSAAWNRGAYLVDVLGHCGECHTPRDRLGGPNRDRLLAGTAHGPEGGVIPNITPEDETGIGRWSEGDLDSLFSIGMLPDGDFVGEGMGEVVEETTSRWSAADRKAAITYIRSLPPIRNRVKKETSARDDDAW